VLVRGFEDADEDGERDDHREKDGRRDQRDATERVRCPVGRAQGAVFPGAGLRC
jgi:hypothetical protein